MVWSQARSIEPGVLANRPLTQQTISAASNIPIHSEETHPSTPRGLTSQPLSCARPHQARAAQNFASGDAPGACNVRPLGPRVMCRPMRPAARGQVPARQVPVRPPTLPTSQETLPVVTVLDTPRGSWTHPEGSTSHLWHHATILCPKIQAPLLGCLPTPRSCPRRQLLPPAEQESAIKLQGAIQLC